MQNFWGTIYSVIFGFYTEIEPIIIHLKAHMVTKDIPASEANMGPNLPH